MILQFLTISLHTVYILNQTACRIIIICGKLTKRQRHGSLNLQEFTNKGWVGVPHSGISIEIDLGASKLLYWDACSAQEFLGWFLEMPRFQSSFLLNVLQKEHMITHVSKLLPPRREFEWILWVMASVKTNPGCVVHLGMALTLLAPHFKKIMQTCLKTTFARIILSVENNITGKLIWTD